MVGLPLALLGLTVHIPLHSQEGQAWLQHLFCPQESLEMVLQDRGKDALRRVCFWWEETDGQDNYL